MKHLRLDELKLLKNQLNQSLDPKMLFLQVLIETGARVSEVLDLTRDSLASDNTLTVLPKKNSQKRAIKLSALVAQKFRLYVGHKKLGQIICDSTNPDSQRRAAHRICLYVGQKFLNRKLSAHMIRHTVFTFLYLETKDIMLVQRWAGHKSINSTLVYLHSTENENTSLLWGDILSR